MKTGDAIGTITGAIVGGSGARVDVWVRLPRVIERAGRLSGECGPTNDLPMRREIAVGFGNAGYSKDGIILWEESQCPDWEDYPTVATVESLAKEDPDRDWRIFFNSPFYELEFQRQGEATWVLTKNIDPRGRSGADVGKSGGPARSVCD